MIELKQIRKDYGECTVIKNQSLSIKDKEFFVLIGLRVAPNQPDSKVNSSEQSFWHTNENQDLPVQSKW